MSTGLFQFSAPECQYPTKTLAIVRFGVSNVTGSLVGPEIQLYHRWKTGHLGLAAYTNFNNRMVVLRNRNGIGCTLVARTLERLLRRLLRVVVCNFY